MSRLARPEMIAERAEAMRARMVREREQAIEAERAKREQNRLAVEAGAAVVAGQRIGFVFATPQAKRSRAQMRAVWTWHRRKLAGQTA